CLPPAALRGEFRSIGDYRRMLHRARCASDRIPSRVPRNVGANPSSSHFLHAQPTLLRSRRRHRRRRFEKAFWLSCCKLIGDAKMFNWSKWPVEQDEGQETRPCLDSHQRDGKGFWLRPTRTSDRTVIGLRRMIGLRRLDWTWSTKLRTTPAFLPGAQPRSHPHRRRGRSGSTIVSMLVSWRLPRTWAGRLAKCFGSFGVSSRYCSEKSSS